MKFPGVRQMTVLIVLAVFAVLALIYLLFKNNSFLSFDDSKKTYEVVTKWDLPEELNEISGMSWMKDAEIACIQDEDGIIFIYDLDLAKITDTIQFAEKGDFEAIALDGKDAYVMRSDGLLHEIINFRQPDFILNKYQTPLKNYDIEGIGLDEKNNRLLVTVKEVPDEEQEYKGIYAFDLETKELDTTPVFRINTNDAIFEGLNGRGSQKIIRPSEITKHPTTNDWYILEGHQPKLMILDSLGESKKIHLLDPEKFQQAEGLTFKPDGTMYISNESRRAPANILEVRLNSN